ncbi:MAG: ABC-2 family transporter protein [Oscillospiraceae bacterium]|jgi:ABC-2 type transport system permease protein|nr:ABC-2 family transporter protein [Oscillospiraceae bacterium]
MVIKMNPYIEYGKKAFAKNLVYRSDYIIGVFNTVIMVFIQVAIWRAIYGSNTQINGVPFSYVATSFVLSICFAAALTANDFVLADKVLYGSITTELLKPISINLCIMADTIGNNLFKLIMQFAPAVIISGLFLGLLPPASVLMLLLCVFSLIFGFLIVYYISYIIQACSFWFTNVWSLSVIKNSVISILSGTLIPLWFLPDWLAAAIKWTPFDVIYFAPIQIYLGQMNTQEIIFTFAKQIVWVLLFAVLGMFIYKKGIKKLCIAGG